MQAVAAAASQEMTVRWRRGTREYQLQHPLLELLSIHMNDPDHLLDAPLAQGLDPGGEGSAAQQAQPGVQPDDRGQVRQIHHSAAGKPAAVDDAALWLLEPASCTML
jgi:hypothetical protein